MVKRFLVLGMVPFFLLTAAWKSAAASDCRVQTTRSRDAVVPCVKAAKSRFDLTAADSPDEALRQFFECFPNDYKTFVDIFGYRDVKDEQTHEVELQLSPLYDEALSYVYEVFHRTEAVVGKKVFTAKLISISLDGYWDADAMNYFHALVVGSLSRDPGGFLSQLSACSDTEIDSFWNYYFDGAHRAYHDQPFAEGTNPMDVCKGNESKKACGVLRKHVERLTSPPKPTKPADNHNQKND